MSALLCVFTIPPCWAPEAPQPLLPLLPTPGGWLGTMGISQASVVYGTDERSWSQNRGIKAFTICTFQNFGGVMTISNLRSLNLSGFHVRGWDHVVRAVSSDFLDRRGRHHNNSDGFEGGDGSTVHNCYFE